MLSVHLLPCGVGVTRVGLFAFVRVPGYSTARRRRRAHSWPKHASARATCLERARRNHREVFSQVASGKLACAAQGRGGSSSYNDPLNKVDPLGLRPGDDALGGRATPPPPPTPPRKGMGGIGFASPRAPAHHPDAMHDRPWNRDPTPACSDVGSFPEGAIRFTPAMRWANETRAGTFTNEFRVCYGNDQGYAWAHFVELIQYQAGCWVMNFPDGPGNAVDGACAQDYDVWAVEVDYEDGTRQSMGSARTTPLAFYTGDSSMTGHYYFTVPNQASTSGVFGWARSRSFGGSLWVWVYHSSRSHNAAERGSHLFGSGKWAGVRIGFGPGGLGVLDTYNACQGAC